MKLSVNILNWNCLDTLKMSIPMLEEELSIIDHEIIVVDNGSDDGSVEFLREKQKVNPKIHLVIFKDNTGISRGKNEGIRVSLGDYLLLLDADVLPVPNSIRMMLAEVEDRGIQALGTYPNKWANEKNRHNCKYHEDYCNKLIVSDKPYTRCCLYYGIYAREVFDKCMMDESEEYSKVGYGWEDHDFYMQMQQAGIDQ